VQLGNISPYRGLLRGVEALPIKYLLYRGNYDRDFPGLGTFEQGKTYRVDQEKALKLLDYKLTDEGGNEVSLFVEVPKPGKERKKIKEVEEDGDIISADNGFDWPRGSFNGG
jgi:hypothetical protein